MAYDPKQHHRHSIRLKGYDYSSAGAYFVTICVHNGESTLGEITNDEMNPSLFGRIAAECWDDLPNHYPHLILDAFVVMPNHVHGILVLDDIPVGAGLKPARDDTPDDVGAGLETAYHTSCPFRDRPRLQDILGATNQYRKKCERYSLLATQLLRTHHSQRTIILRHSRLHIQQSDQLARR